MSDEPPGRPPSSARSSQSIESWKPERRDRDASLLLLLLAAAFVLGFLMASLLLDSRRPAGPDPHAQGRPGPSRSEAPKPPPTESCVPREDCCQVCRAGKACGHSCISRAKLCHQPDGCACDAAEVCS